MACTVGYNSFLWFSFVHYSSLFQYFFLIYYDPYSSWKFLIFLEYLFVNFFENIMIMIEIQYSGTALLLLEVLGRYFQKIIYYILLIMRIYSRAL